MAAGGARWSQVADHARGEGTRTTEAWALGHAAEEADDPGLLERTPWLVLASLLAALAIAAALCLAALVPRALFHATAATCAHAALLVTALGWSGVERASTRHALVVALVALGFAGRCFGDWGALAHLLTPAWLTALALRGRLGPLGLGARVPPAAIALGAALGVFLGAHLLVTASLTLDYGARFGSVERFVSDVAYDAGANVLTAECFFRGALFDRLQRRAPLVLAAPVAAGASVCRYLADPLLSSAPEVLVGAVFYLALLGLASCWLRWWSGSILPGGVATLFFFTAYRLLVCR